MTAPAARYERIGGVCTRGHVWALGDDAEQECGSKSYPLYVEVDEDDVGGAAVAVGVLLHVVAEIDALRESVSQLAHRLAGGAS